MFLLPFVQELGQPKVAQQQPRSIDISFAARVDQTVLKLDVTMHDPCLPMEITDRLRKLVSVPLDRPRRQATPLPVHEIEQRAPGIERGDAAGGKRGLVYGQQRQDVPVLEPAPQHDLVSKLLLDHLVLERVLAVDQPADDLHRPPDLSLALHVDRLAHDAEAAEADLLAERVIAYALALVVWLAGRLLAKGGETAQEAPGGRTGGRGRHP